MAPHAVSHHLVMILLVVSVEFKFQDNSRAGPEAKDEVTFLPYLEKGLESPRNIVLAPCCDAHQCRGRRWGAEGGAEQQGVGEGPGGAQGAQNQHWAHGGPR